MTLIDIELSLKMGGYRCRLALYDSEMLLFEDDAIVGFAVLYETPAKLITSWQDKQALFIQKNTGTLRRAGTKSWNCYAIFLCSESATETEKHAIAEIEEDLGLTRKIVSEGVMTTRDVQRALLPILPIQNHTAASGSTALDLLQRLENWSPQAVRALEGEATAAELVEILWNAQ
jgi:ABC-three component (ABC-3C) system Middle Component 1